MPLGTTTRFATKFSDRAGIPSGISLVRMKMQLFVTSAKRQHHAIGSDFCLVMTFVLVGNGMHFLSNVCHLGLSYFLTDKKLSCRRDCATPDAYFEGSVHKGSISKKSKFFRKRVFVFRKFHFLILPTRSDNCILVFIPLEVELSLKVLWNCVILKLLIYRNYGNSGKNV